VNQHTLSPDMGGFCVDADRDGDDVRVYARRPGATLRFLGSIRVAGRGAPDPVGAAAAAMPFVLETFDPVRNLGHAEEHIALTCGSRGSWSRSRERSRHGTARRSRPL
jgi:hypothetical protein